MFWYIDSMENENFHISSIYIKILCQKSSINIPKFDRNRILKLTSNTTFSGLFGTKSVSSLVRLAISSNFPASLLNSAQSYPSLGAASATSTASPGSGVGVVGSGGQNHDTEQVSLEEFLESCRATSLLAELEDDEELPEAEDEDNDDEANDDEEDYDENFDEESATSEPRNTASTLTSRYAKLYLYVFDFTRKQYTQNITDGTEKLKKSSPKNSINGMNQSIPRILLIWFNFI